MKKILKLSTIFSFCLILTSCMFGSNQVHEQKTQFRFYGENTNNNSTMGNKAGNKAGNNIGNNLISDNKMLEKIKQNQSVIPKVIQTLKQQLNKQYVLGGTSPSTGFDCSGLIHWAYKQHGITIPRVSYEQAKVGQKISKNNLQQGDILVFKMPDAINGMHVGVYLGNNQFIHAKNEFEDIGIDSLTDKNYSTKFIDARRVVN